MWPFIAERPRAHALTDWLYLIERDTEIERERLVQFRGFDVIPPQLVGSGCSKIQHFSHVEHLDRTAW